MTHLRTAFVLSLLWSVACQHDTATASPADAAEAARDVGAPRAAVVEYNLDESLALHGYDPVAYFPEGGSKPTPGSSKHALRYNGVVYTFSSKKNLQTFEASPEKFEPAYGGWCAWAMVRGGKVDVDPENYIIQGGRLMVFYRNALVDTRDKWNEGNTMQLESDANVEWKDISGEG